ncbi:hypothetical protein IFR05_014802 [Cadophora sp. M221]|nr:hypothetical protein IFR05_014802 [Cadophora sp. M221]
MNPGRTVTQRESRMTTCTPPEANSMRKHRAVMGTSELIYVLQSALQPHFRVDVVVVRGDNPEQSVDVASWALSSEVSINLLEGDQTRNPTLTLSRKSLYHLTSQVQPASFLSSRPERGHPALSNELSGRVAKLQSKALSLTCCDDDDDIGSPVLVQRRRSFVRKQSWWWHAMRYLQSSGPDPVPLQSHFNLWRISMPESKILTFQLAIFRSWWSQLNSRARDVSILKDGEGSEGEARQLDTGFTKLWFVNDRGGHSTTKDARYSCLVIDQGFSGMDHG